MALRIIVNFAVFVAAFNPGHYSSPVEKVNYMRARLEGDAADVISGRSLTNANYEQSINLLKERYGQNGVIMNVYYTSLMGLP